MEFYTTKICFTLIEQKATYFITAYKVKLKTGKEMQLTDGYQDKMKHKKKKEIRPAERNQIHQHQ
jgi:hypothetical protein